MFTALDKNNNLINIADTKVDKEYFCKHCKEKVIVKAKNSRYKAPHFCHKKNSNCVEQWAQHDMSEWHKIWQSYFPLECQEVIVKNDNIKHIADVLVNKFVIEFQHSPISYKNFTERNQFYTSLGCYVVWVFDATDKVYWKAEEKCYYWKNVQNQFKISKDQNIFIFLEIKNNQGVPLLIRPKEITPNKIILHPKTDFFGNRFSRESFLKDYGVQVPEGILSIHELLFIFNYYQQQRCKRTVLSPAYPNCGFVQRGPRINYVFNNQTYRKPNQTNRYKSGYKGGRSPRRK